MIYLDANAGDVLRPEARQAMQEAWDEVGNPSSLHGSGRAARTLLERSRATVAAKLGGLPRHLIFTSGGTEAAALALHALGGGRRVMVGATEHDAILSGAPHADRLPVDREGQVALEALEAALRRDEPALVALMLANNETGVLHPIANAATLCRRSGALLLVDAAQALDRIPLDLTCLGADAITVSAHKMGGPQGVGALLLANDWPAVPLIAGGGQERGWRGGTHNLPAIAGFAAACRSIPPDLAPLRDRIAETACEVGALLAGAAAPRLPNTLCLILPAVRADLQLMTLDLEGFAVSSGSACSSGKVAKSHVLQAMGYGEEAGCAIRVSLSWRTTADEVERFIVAYRGMARRLGARRARGGSLQRHSADAHGVGNLSPTG